MDNLLIVEEVFMRNPETGALLYVLPFSTSETAKHFLNAFIQLGYLARREK